MWPCVTFFFCLPEGLVESLVVKAVRSESHHHCVGLWCVHTCKEALMWARQHAHTHCVHTKRHTHTFEVLQRAVLQQQQRSVSVLLHQTPGGAQGGEDLRLLPPRERGRERELEREREVRDLTRSRRGQWRSKGRKERKGEISTGMKKNF